MLKIQDLVAITKKVFWSRKGMQKANPFMIALLGVVM
jgi:hypothetical protein